MNTFRGLTRITFEKKSRRQLQTGSVLTSVLLFVGGIVGTASTLYHVFVPKIEPPTSSQPQIIVTPYPTQTFPVPSPIIVTPYPTQTPNSQIVEQIPVKNLGNGSLKSNSMNFIKCLGADRKYSRVSRLTCEKTRKYWTKILGWFPTDPDEIIKCQGADGKYANVSRKTCEDTNRFWAEHPPQGVNNSSGASSESTGSTVASTPISTPTPVPTDTPTLGPTETPTPTPTETPTPTPTPTDTPTPTPTSTPDPRTASGPITATDGQVITGLHITSNSGPCVTITNKANVWINDSEIGPCGSDGVFISGGSGHRITNSIIHTDHGGPGNVGMGVFILGSASNILVHSNQFSTNESSIYAQSSSNIRVIGNYSKNPQGPYPRGQHIQFNGITSGSVTDNYGVATAGQSDQEDAINLYQSNSINIARNYMVGGDSTTGCGILIGDEGGTNDTVQNNTLIRTAQCGIGIAGGSGHIASGNKILDTNTVGGAGNVGLYVDNFSGSPCSNITVTDNIVSNKLPNNSYNDYYNAGNCGAVTASGNIYGDPARTLLVPESTLLPPPSIPPCTYNESQGESCTTDTTAPTGGSISYTDGYYTAASVALTVDDGSDGTGSGINALSRIVQRKSATLSGGTCGNYGNFATITTSGSYPNYTDSSVLSANCYIYQYLVSDNAGNQAIYTSSNTAKIDAGNPTDPGTASITTSNNATPTWTWTASTDSVSGLANPAYTVEWSQDSGFASGVSSSASNTNSYTHLSALTNGTWYFRVKAADTAGNFSNYSSNGLSTVFPQNLLTSLGSEYEGFDTFAQWTQTSGTIANDAVNFRTGTASLKLTTGVGTSASATKTISTNFGTAPNMRISFYLAETYNDLSNVQIRFTSQSSFATVKYASPGRGTGFHSGWNTVDIYPSDWQDIGGESWANTMIRLRVQVIPISGKTANVSLDSLVRDTTGYPAVIISFDDGFSDAYTKAFPNMQSRKVKGTAFIITDIIGGGSNVSAVQLQEMFAAGWTIGNHTSDHTSLSGVTEATQETKIGDAKTVLTGLGITTGDHLALPYGSWDENTLTACRNLGIKTNRTVQEVAYPLVNSDQLLLESSHVPINTTTLATMEAWVDEAKTKNTPVWFQFHQIVDSPSSTYQWSTTNFQSLLDYMLSQGVRSLTADEFYRLNSGPITVGHL
jgi:peptidoglycan/xylan/chitin deacetylase (PgdA/CDA1 family)